eukprot:976252-Prorocentrum_minimum.AAC.1
MYIACTAVVYLGCSLKLPVLFAHSDALVLLCRADLLHVVLDHLLPLLWGPTGGEEGGEERGEEGDEEGGWTQRGRRAALRRRVCPVQRHAQAAPAAGGARALGAHPRADKADLDRMHISRCSLVAGCGNVFSAACARDVAAPGATFGHFGPPPQGR